MRNPLRTLMIVGVVGVLLAAAAPGYAGNEGAVTYYKDVLPIMQNNCQTCHRPSGLNISGLIAPMSLMSYQETRPSLGFIGYAEIEPASQSDQQQ